MIETDDYIVCANPRRFWWQKKQMKWLVVGYYNADSEREAAIAAAEHRAQYVTEHLTQLPIEMRLHKRPVWRFEDEEMTDIIYTTLLDKYNRLNIRDVPVNAPERYIWNIEFLDENGEEFGVCSEGIWFDSVAAALAAGRTYYLMELLEDEE